MNRTRLYTVQIGDMQIDSNQALAKGQVWNTGVADFEIMALGEDFIHYTVRKLLGERRVSAQVSGIDALENYLRFNQARLIRVAGED